MGGPIARTLRLPGTGLDPPLLVPAGSSWLISLGRSRMALG